MKIAIVGAGVAGLAAAYDLVRARHNVTVFEAAPIAGGLASGFKAPHWDWSLERFYHHLFTTDADMIKLVDEIGFRDKLFFRGQKTAQWWNGTGYDLNGPLQVLRFPGMPFLDRVRFGMVAAYLKFGTNNWQALEKQTAATWTSRWAGPAVYRTIWRPLLEGKFGPYADDVNMAWLWARIKARSFKLGYFVGGFQAFVDALQGSVERLGASVQLSTPITALQPEGNGWQISTSNGTQQFDRVIVTGSPTLLEKLAPQLPSTYIGQLRNLRSMGAVVMTIALHRPLTKGQLYWVNLPKNEFPCLALVEHTNFIDAKHYGGDHLIYCGDYLEPNHEYFHLTPDELLERFLPALSKMNPAFDRSWVRTFWLHREPYAQPIVNIHHSQHIPALKTPLAGLYWASMSQVYPWDRGTNFAVELGRRVASEALKG
jgi:protoporphyrinogen oxidase